MIPWSSSGSRLSSQESAHTLVRPCLSQSLAVNDFFMKGANRTRANRLPSSKDGDRFPPYTTCRLANLRYVSLASGTLSLPQRVAAKALRALFSLMPSLNWRLFHSNASMPIFPCLRDKSCTLMSSTKPRSMRPPRSSGARFSSAGINVPPKGNYLPQAGPLKPRSLVIAQHEPL